MAMADLLKSDLLGEAIDHLDEEECQILGDAGIISQRKPKGRRKSNHIVFVENEEEGMIPSLHEC